MKSTFLALSASMLLGSAAALPADTSSTVKATSSAVSATSSTPSATPGPKKRGLSYNDPTLTTLFNGPNSQISWGYDWGQVPGTGFDSAYEFVPMLWNNAAGATDNWFAHVEAAIAKGTDHLLAFNEPDYSGQANMTPEEAAAAYLLWMEPFAGRVKLGAPAVTNGGAPMGLTWLAEFMGNCTLCTIDFVPFHWYDSAQNYWYFKAYIEQVYAQVQRPIWITEFNGYGDDATIISFMEMVMPWLDQLDYVERYAWFGDFDGYLLSSGDTLSDYGVVYMNYTSDTLTPYFSD